MQEHITEEMLAAISNTLTFSKKYPFRASWDFCDYTMYMMRIPLEKFELEFEKHLKWLPNSIPELRKCCSTCSQTPQSKDEIFNARLSWIPMLYEEIFLNKTYQNNTVIEHEGDFKYSPTFYSKELIADCFNVLDLDLVKNMAIALLQTTQPCERLGLLCSGDDLFILDAKGCDMLCAHPRLKINTLEGLCEVYGMVFTSLQWIATSIFKDGRISEHLKKLFERVQSIPNEMHMTEFCKLKYFPNQFEHSNEKTQLIFDALITAFQNNENTLPFDNLGLSCDGAPNFETFTQFLKLLMHSSNSMFEYAVAKFPLLRKSFITLRTCCQNIKSMVLKESEIFLTRICWMKDVFEEMIGNNYATNKQIEQSFGSEYNYKPLFYSKELIIDCKVNVFDVTLLRKMTISLIYKTHYWNRVGILCNGRDIYFMEACWNRLDITERYNCNTIDGLCEAFSKLYSVLQCSARTVYKKHEYSKMVDYLEGEESKHPTHSNVSHSQRDKENLGYTIQPKTKAKVYGNFTII